jgi:hypothetical protein
MDAGRVETTTVLSLFDQHDLVSEDFRMDSEMMVCGAIIDSWTERADTRLVLQVAPRGRPRELMIVEAEASLIPDTDWLEDLRENLCHGSPVSAIGRPTKKGLLRATRLQLVR